MFCRGRSFVSWLFYCGQTFHTLWIAPPVTTALCSSSSSRSNGTPSPDQARRDLLWKVPVGTVGAYVYGTAISKGIVRSIDLKYPEAHERRVKTTISDALTLSAETVSRFIPSSPTTEALRVLEVGIGQECRLIRRGLYQPGIESLARAAPNIQRVEITGVDLRPPDDTTLYKAQEFLQDSIHHLDLEANLQIVGQSITSRLNYPDGHFDCIVCCLTLCSVDDPMAALREIRRLLRPTGGTFGYVEHVAVDPAEPYRFLEWQQRTLDPLQQILADNCHLHRSTERDIAVVFAPSEASLVQQERFLVESMWPVTCQCCGVYQRHA